MMGVEEGHTIHSCLGRAKVVLAQMIAPPFLCFSHLVRFEMARRRCRVCYEIPTLLSLLGAGAGAKSPQILIDGYIVHIYLDLSPRKDL